MEYARADVLARGAEDKRKQRKTAVRRCSSVSFFIPNIKDFPEMF